MPSRPIVRAEKHKRLLWAVYAAMVRETRNANRILVLKTVGKCPIALPRRK
jgi:hypothetical protein